MMSNEEILCAVRAVTISEEGRNGKLTTSQERVGKLMERAIEAGYRNKRLPGWFFLVCHMKGALKWVLLFGLFGASIALEPVYAAAEASADLLPKPLKKRFMRLSKEMREFIRYTVIGEIYGERFRYIVNLIKECKNTDTIISLGSGSGVAEIVGIWLRAKAFKSVPRLLLVDTSRRILRRAEKFAALLGVSDYVRTEKSTISTDYQVPKGAGRVLVGSWGLAGNYFPDGALSKLINSLASQESVKVFSTDFANENVTQCLRWAIGWPSVESEEDLRGYEKIKPRSEPEKFFINDKEHDSEFVFIADGKIPILEVRRN